MSDPLVAWGMEFYCIAQQHWPQLTWEQFAAAGQAVTTGRNMSLKEVAVELRDKLIEMHGSPAVPFEDQ